MISNSAKLKLLYRCGHECCVDVHVFDGYEIAYQLEAKEMLCPTCQRKQLNAILGSNIMS
jgi:hypothetical protein